MILPAATTAARRRRRVVEEEEDEASAEKENSEWPEPNMRFSRAVIVILLIHIVALAGVLAFGLSGGSRPPKKPIIPVTRTASISETAAEGQTSQSLPTISRRSAALHRSGTSPNVNTSIDTSRGALGEAPLAVVNTADKLEAVSFIEKTTPEHVAPPKNAKMQSSQRITKSKTQRSSNVARTASKHGSSQTHADKVNRAKKKHPASSK